MGRKALAVQADVSQPDSVGEAFAEFKKHFDRVDLVVSNAALGVLKPALEMTLKHFRRCMETNALALNTLAQNAVPMMSAGGSIIGLTSLGSERAIPNYTFIGASKAALEPSPAASPGTRTSGDPGQLRQRRCRRYRCPQAFPNREHLLDEYKVRTPLARP